MGKTDEIDYIRQVAAVEQVSEEEFRRYLAAKPFSDPRCGEYLMDIAQIMRFLPRPPRKLLDLGVGSGWTSELFARCGYDVLGIDISPDMIELANARTTTARFSVLDYEKGPIPEKYGIAVIYDALHHAEDPGAVIRNVHDALDDGGILVTIEPGAGHSITADSIAVMAKYGTTEKDMPYGLQRRLMKEAGFSEIRQYTRVSQLPLEDISATAGALRQLRHGFSIAYGSATGLTSVVIATRTSPAPAKTEDGVQAQVLLDAAAVHDEFLKRRR